MEIMMMIVIVAAGIGCTLLEKHYEKKEEDNAYIYRSVFRLMDISDDFHDECSKILEKYGENISSYRFSEEIEKVYEYYRDNPYEIYKKKYNRELPDLSYSTFQSYTSKLYKIKSTYIQAYSYLVKAKSSHYCSL